MSYNNIQNIDRLTSDNAQIFVDLYTKEAKKIEVQTGLHFVAILTQSALESGWGTRVKGNNFFGIKWNGKGEKQLVRTKEVLNKSGVKFPVIHSVKIIGNMYHYDVEDYFMRYENASESFMHHAEFIKSNPRYSKAWEHRADYNRYFEEVAKAGYATAINYEKTLKEVAKSVLRRL